MRTTIKIDDDVLRAARVLADIEGKTIGQVLSELARKGLQPAYGLHDLSDIDADPRGSRHGFPTFVIREGTPPLTPGLVQRAAEDDD